MAAIGADRIYFNTEALPERDRFPAFCEGMFRHVIGADIVRSGEAPFRGALDVHRVGAVGIADISVTDATITRHTSHISDGNDCIVVQLWRRGEACATQGKRESRIASRVGLVIDNARPATICTGGPSQFFTLTIPRDKIIPLLSGRTDLAAGTFTENAAFRLLLGYWKEIATQDLNDRQIARLVGNHLIDLAAFALEGGSSRSSQERGVRVARRVAILREIDRRSSNPGLSAAVIAAELGVTLRYVHLLLEETGKSFTHHVLERRLDKATALLRDPKWCHRKIADVAAEAGFTDLSYFNRAFRQHFGARPSDVRASANPRG